MALNCADEFRCANHATAWARNRSEPLLIAGVDKSFAESGASGRGEVRSSVHARRDFLHIPDRILNYLFKDAWAHNYHHCLRGALGHGANASSLRAATYQTIAGGERTLR
jgi:hypothetical protein